MKNLRIAAVLCLAVCPVRGEAPAGQPYTAGKFFSAVFPKGWVKKEPLPGLSDAERKVYGVEFFGPASGGLAARIGAHYYAPGNLVHKTPERFIKLHSQPALGVNLSKKVYGPVTAGKAGSYYAKIFERKVFEYLPPGALHPRKTAVYEKFAVVPVGNGFYVLDYYAPLDIAGANLKAYEAVLASFRPQAR